jgi:ABC-type transport system substrate-binding protein
MITEIKEYAMSRRKILAIIASLLVLSMILGACKSAATEEPVAPSVQEPAVAPEEPAVEEPAIEEPVVEEPSEAAGMDVYRIAILSDITSSNLWNLYGPGASAWNYVVQVGYWPGLFTLSDHRYDFVPQLAADYGTPVEEEGEYWVSTIPIKDNFLWSDGSEITADDVAFTWQVVNDFELSGNWDYAIEELNRIEAVDPKTVKFFYNEKPGLAIHEFGLLQNPVVSKEFWGSKLEEAYTALDALSAHDPEGEEYIAALAEAQQILYGVEAEGEPVYGAYLFEKWEVGAFVENSANGLHFYKGVVAEEFADGSYRESLEGKYGFSAYGDPVGEPELAIQYGPNANSVLYSVYSQDAAVLALLNGDVDYIYNPSGYGPGLKAQLESNADVSIVENPRNGWRFMGFNFDTPPMDDIAARQAITCMIDKEFLTQNVLQGAVFPAYTPVPEGLAFWYSPDVSRICDGLSEQERMEWAIERLSGAGYTWDVMPTWNEARGGSIDWGDGLKMPDGSYVEELLLLAPSPGYDPLRATTGVLIEQWAGMIGFPVRARLTNFNNILNETLGGGGNFDMVVMGWNLTTYPDHMCDFFLDEYGGPFAFTGYASEELKSLCVEFKASTDLEEAKLLGFEMQELLATELPYTYLFANPVVDAYNATAAQFPFTEVLDGIEGLYGMQNIVNSPE